MATLLLRLAAPLQAWGCGSKFNIRTTEREPTKSGVIGMIAAALGIQRNDAESDKRLEKLNKLRFGIRVDREGKLLKDFHMVFTDDISDSERRKTPPKDLNKYIHTTERYYLSDAVFLAAFESESRKYLEEIINALNNPEYPLFLGRRSCPPTLPIIIGISDDGLVETLKKAAPLTNTKISYKRIVYESDDGGTVVQDVPVSFSQLHRIHGYRYKKEEMLSVTEHDPMAEL